ncbi:MAG: hypothetical protein ABI990_03420 [Actinomycetota bacterium]
MRSAERLLPDRVLENAVEQAWRAGLRPLQPGERFVIVSSTVGAVLEKTPPPPEFVPEDKAEILERTVVATLGVLGVLGAHIT